MSQDVIDGRAALLKAEWQRHPYTKTFLNWLGDNRERLLASAENLSLDVAPASKDITINKLLCAKQIREIINYVKE